MTTTFTEKILTVFASQAKPYLIGAAGLVLALAGLFLWKGTGHKALAIVAPPAAVEHHDPAVEAKGEAKAQHQVRVARDPALDAARQETAQAKAELAQALEALRLAGLTPAPATPDDLKGAALEKCIETTQAQDRKAGLLEAQLTTVTAEAEAQGRAAAAFEQEALVLRKVAAKPIYHRSAGLIWNPQDQTHGLFIEQDLWRVRLGADLVQQRLPAEAGGRFKWSAQVRAGFCF